MELINTDNGVRLYEFPLDGQAISPPCFSNDGRKVTVCTRSMIYTFDTETRKELYAVYDENGFRSRVYSYYAYSEDDRYLFGPYSYQSSRGADDIRDAETGKVVWLSAPEPCPAWEIGDAPGTMISIGNGHMIFLPSFETALEDLRAHIREYEFTKAERQKYALP